MMIALNLVLVVLLLSAAVHGFKDVHQVERRNLEQFRRMVMFTTGKNGFTVLQYIYYGCYCGWGGKGTPVDELDKCCKIHDECYIKLKKEPFCIPKLRTYHWRKQENKIECYKGFADWQCDMNICECDRAAAHCIAKHPLQDKYQMHNKKSC